MRYLTFAVLTLLTMKSLAQSHELYKNVMLDRLNNAKVYTIAMAEAMPEAHYGFKPMDDEMGFGEQLVHIANNLTGISKRYITDRAIDFNTKPDALQKAAVIELLQKAWDYAITTVSQLSEEDMKTKVNFFAGEKNKMQMVNLLNDHQAHHRGQIAVYLRMKAVVPPRYIGW